MNELLSSRRRLGVALLASSLIALTAAGSALTASLDARFDGTASSDGAGHAVSSASDFNNDGTEDMIVGARAANRAYIVFGGPGLGTVGLGALGAGGVTITGEAGGALGHSVAAAGDVVDDGIDDVIVGDENVTGANGADSGRAYVIYGSATPATTPAVASLTRAGTDFRIDGAGAGEDAGISVAGVGDVNNDGVDDVAVGSGQDGSTADAGRADVVFGTPSVGTRRAHGGGGGGESSTAERRQAPGQPRWQGQADA